jgi:hypothetical protein
MILSQLNATVFDSLNSLSPFYLFLFFCILILALKFYYAILKNKIEQISLKSGDFNFFILIRYVFFIGTMVHELSHALACLILGVKIYKIQPFFPQKDKISGGYILGYVNHEKVDSLRSTIIGLAPIVGCALFTFFIFILVTPLSISNFSSYGDVKLGVSFLDMFQNLKWIFLNFFNWGSLLFIYCAIACSLAGEPSEKDLESMPKLIFMFFIFTLFMYLLSGFATLLKLSEFFLNFINLISPILIGLIFVMLFELFILFLLVLFFSVILRR